MLLKFLADIVLLLHFSFILFALFGGLLVLWKRRALWFHLPAMAWSSVVNLLGVTCPLTPLENYFRTAAGEAGYAGGFIRHYIEPLVYPEQMPGHFELIAAVSVVVWNMVVYGFVVYLRYRKKNKDR